MRGALHVVCNGAAGLCGLLIGLLALVIEWSFIRDNFLQFINPLLQLEVIIRLLIAPGFWVLLILGLFFGWVAGKLEFSSQTHDETPVASGWRDGD